MDVTLNPTHGPWEPGQRDIEWITSLIRIIKDGGVWGIPAAQSTFTLFKNSKKFIFSGNREHDLVVKTFKVFSVIGWKEATNEPV